MGSYDVIVIGAGNAGLSAAIAASELGAKTLVLERAPVHLRGGNSYFTGGLFRFAYNGIDDIRSLISEMSDKESENVDVGSYPKNKFYEDVMRVTEGLADPQLVEILTSNSFSTMEWLASHRIPWILAYGRQAFEDSGKMKFWGGLILEAVGAGKGLSDSQFSALDKLGVEVMYDSRAISLLIDQNSKVEGVKVRHSKQMIEINASSVVLASGGFESNPEMRTRYLGPGWELAKVRGTQFNTGDGIQMALDVGAQSFGHWSGCHSVQWDFNSPNFGDRNIADLFQKHSYPFGILVNILGKRFLDEGADFRNYTYAKYGREVLHQPQRIAFQIFDEKTKHLLRDEYNIPQVSKVTASSIEELGEGIGVDPVVLAKTVSDFNNSIVDGEFNPTLLDQKCTQGIFPPKSNWAQPIDTPPYSAFAVTCGITFTFGGLRINSNAQVLENDDYPIEGLYAAGELVGGLFYNNYPGGAGLMAGSVFGRLAGESAANNALIGKL